MNKVAVALSGGIDSAVTAALLKEQGYEVVGITARMTCSEDAELVVQNANKVAQKLGIEHFVLDSTKEFEEKVIKYFESSYKEGKTPNPCILCNKYIKWGLLFDYCINTLKVDYIATGHYANIKEENGIYKLFPASDEHKDQLYFLFLLTQEQLSKTLFPLSKYKKEDVKKLAEQYDLPPKSAKESQDICFIKPPLTTKKYLNSILKNEKGKFIEKSSGKILGYHNGYWQYTIGQRKGIGLAAPEALYVININALSNTVFVGYKNELLAQTLELNNIHWNYPINNQCLEILVKIRYNMKAVKATISNNKVDFIEPVSGITPGQACVFYNKEDGHLLGGGFIS